MDRNTLNARDMERKEVRRISPVRTVRVSIPKTLALIKRGETARFTVRDMNISSLRARVCELNKKAGREEYTVTAYDNGAEFDVRRN